MSDSSPVRRPLGRGALLKAKLEEGKKKRELERLRERRQQAASSHDVTPTATDEVTSETGAPSTSQVTSRVSGSQVKNVEELLETYPFQSSFQVSSLMVSDPNNNNLRTAERGHQSSYSSHDPPGEPPGSLPPPVSKQGIAGRPVQLSANYLKLHVQEGNGEI